MTSVKDKTRPIRVCVVSIALSIAFGSVSASLDRRSAQDQKASGTMYSSKRMADGKQWTTHNLNVNIVPSYCYEDAERNCRQYGRLYTWESARRGCQSLGDRSFLTFLGSTVPPDPLTNALRVPHSPCSS